MLLPINSSLLVQVYAWGATASPQITVVTRRAGGLPQVNTIALTAISTNGLTSNTIPLLADELLYYALTNGQAGTDGGISAVVSVQYQSGNIESPIVSLSWGTIYQRPIHSWAETQLITGDMIQARPFPVPISDNVPGAAVTLSLSSSAWSLESLYTLFTTSAVAGSRIPFIAWVSQTMGNVTQAYLQTGVPATTAARVNFSTMGDHVDPAASRQAASIPRIITDPGGSVTLNAVSIDATDVFTNTAAVVRLWPVVAPT